MGAGLGLMILSKISDIVGQRYCARLSTDVLQMYLTKGYFTNFSDCHGTTIPPSFPDPLSSRWSVYHIDQRGDEKHNLMQSSADTP